jgi:hypothetical protein
MFNIDQGVIHQTDDGWVPVYVDKEQRLGIMSIGFLLNSSTDAVIWRGPKKNCIYIFFQFKTFNRISQVFAFFNAK